MEATWADVSGEQRVRGTAVVAPWLLGGCALALLLIGSVAARLSYDTHAGGLRLAALTAGVLLCCAAALTTLVESQRLLRLRLLDWAGVAAALATLGVAAAYIVVRPHNGGPHAGALVALLPLALLSLRAYPPRAQQIWSPASVPAALSISALLLGVGTLLATGERSAVLALALGGALAVGALWLAQHAPGAVVWAVGGALLLALLTLAAAGWTGIMPAWLADRFALWREALPLLGDYRFTGSGLGSTELVFASYAHLTHVPYTAHLHNLYLQAMLEMGLFGLAALLGIFGAALAATLQPLRRSTGTTQRAAAAVLAALLASLLLGLVDAETFATLWVTTLFAPAAVALLVQATARAEAHRDGVLEYPPRDVPGAGRAVRTAVIVLLPAVGLLAALLAWGYAAAPELEAAWTANRAALLQEQIELTNYDQAPWAFQDAIRRTHAEALRSVQAGYQQALLLDPANATAHRRLGQLALSLGDLQAADGFLTEAHHLNPQDQATAQLLGEVRALQGDTDGAAALWLPLVLVHNQLGTRLAWQQTVGSAADAANLERAIERYNAAVAAATAQE